MRRDLCDFPGATNVAMPLLPVSPVVRGRTLTRWPRQTSCAVAVGRRKRRWWRQRRPWRLRSRSSGAAYRGRVLPSSSR